MMKHDSTLILSHYYCTPDVQAQADYVGDSLDLAMRAVEEKPKRIVFAGVKFMGETAKILNPETEVIMPDGNATCSLVTQTNIDELRQWRESYPDHVHVSYINSSSEHKMFSDVIVTSRIVEDVIENIYEQGKKVIFSPDYNMGAYLNAQYGYNMPLWSAVCEVHDKFKAKELDAEMKGWTDGPKFVLAHPESPLSILERADYIGSTHGMLEWIKNYKGNIATIWVATEDGLLYNMRELRPSLDIRQAPTYSGCGGTNSGCAVCPYMKMNTIQSLNMAVMAGMGSRIDYLTDEQMDAARLPIQRMLDFQRTGVIDLSM